MDDRGSTSGPAAFAESPLSKGAQRRAPTIGVAGFVLALAGMVLPPLGGVGAVLAAIGLAKARRANLPTRLCLAGVILGVLTCIVGSFIIEWILTP